MKAFYVTEGVDGSYNVERIETGVDYLTAVNHHDTASEAWCNAEKLAGVGATTSGLARVHCCVRTRSDCHVSLGAKSGQIAVLRLARPTAGTCQ